MKSEKLNGLPSGMVQVKALVTTHRRVAGDHYFMRLEAPTVAQRAKPGQFIHVQCGDSTLLRRPFSLMDVDAKTGAIDFIYKVVGLGTNSLTEIPAGEKVDLLGPLGHPFEIPAELKRAYLVGGGVGIPPLYLLAKTLLKGHDSELTSGAASSSRSHGSRVQVEAFLGARTKGWVICASDFRRLGIPVHVATDDGTLGTRGSVVDLLKSVVDRQDAVLYICGPTPMMAAAAALTRRKKLAAQVSLEERMGCAMGCCMGCVVEIAAEPAAAHTRFQRVCTEGPVFPAEAILWK
ncbi:MAG: dihydroorotate dehydrogenase electron transfer subunit [Candidatus Omnitrophica bacterium]|nr:dihydroorotate dehydrogenase electron transfer subunit [Candidatus Omnitrophota bacterium]